MKRRAGGGTYPNMRSIHSCKCADTCSLSRAFRCLCTKSTGVLAQGGSFTASDRHKNTHQITKISPCQA